VNQTGSTDISSSVK